jgi:hypothetical protein
VFWYAPDGRFTTSTYYADTLPEWVKRFNERRIPARYAGATWSLLLPETSYPEVDSVVFENFGSSDIKFPHHYPADSTRAAQLFSEFPAMDSTTAQLALEGVAAMKLGAGPQIDLLSVSFSTTDAIGHRYGPDSREVHDQIVRLDRYLGTFIDSLYKLRDSSRIVFALTSDHGVAPFPELRSAREHVMPQRVDINEAFGPIVAGLRAAGIDTLPLAYEEGLIFVDRSRLERRRINPDSLIGVIAVAAGAGGHAGRWSPFALIQEIRAWFDGPLVLSGAIANGGAVLAAQAAGADLAYVGSPFIATEEANAPDAYKSAIVESGAADIVYTDLFTGVHGNYLRSSIVNAGLDPDNLAGIDPTAMKFGSEGSAKAKAWRDIWGSGQGVGVIDQVRPASEYIDLIADQYAAARDRLCAD